MVAIGAKQQKFYLSGHRADRLSTKRLIKPLLDSDQSQKIAVQTYIGGSLDPSPWIGSWNKIAEHPRFEELSNRGKLQAARKHSKSLSRMHQQESQDISFEAPESVSIEIQRRNLDKKNFLGVGEPVIGLTESQKELIKDFFAQQPYHIVAPNKDFLQWFDSTIQAFLTMPAKYKIDYSKSKKPIHVSLQQWLFWLMSNKAINGKQRYLLHLLGFNKLSEKLGIGRFNEWRLGIALQSLKTAGIIKDFFLSKPYSFEDSLGIDALVVIHEDKEGHFLSVPIQVKSRNAANNPFFIGNSSANYRFSSPQLEYLGLNEKLIKSFGLNPKNLPSKIDILVKRRIPSLKAYGLSIVNMRKAIIKRIQDSFGTKDKPEDFFKFYGDLKSKSPIHKFKLMLDQGFFEVKDMRIAST